MKKLIEFYPCPKCNQNLFIIHEICNEKCHQNVYLRFGLTCNLRFKEVTNGLYDIECLKCNYILFKNHNNNEKSGFALIIEIINQFIKDNERKIDKKIKIIWKKYLKQTIKQGLENIAF